MIILVNFEQEYIIQLLKMATSIRDRNKQLYGYVENLLGGNQYQSAVASCYNHLSQKKIQWTIDLQKIMELFLDLAFLTEKHSKIKQVLKYYRAVTQNQHPDSLKSILESYRDSKLQQILQQEIPKQSIKQIMQMGNIEDDEASSEIVLSSFSSNTKNKKEEIKVNLSIVWEGYKAIVDTVRFNHKLEAVYRQTLKRIFEFVQKYNRKHEFKSFCEYLRLGLKSVLNKRGDKNEQQKGFYIDIEKEQVNTNNIQIRFDQFDLATKLGLWQEAFQILEDIKEIMKVRKGPVKNSLRCSYFERLSRVFKKSNYWHYHAYAFFNYYSIYVTKSKLSLSQKTKMADKLILSILCIPPSTLESSQSKESQLKIASMMISGNKIPDKNELERVMISKGVIQAASNPIKELWYFMFLEFDLTSLNKGLKLLENIPKQDDYKQFIELLEEILIYKQLISVAELYQCIKFQSLISIIPLPRQKIQKILLQSHHRKVIDFVFDEKQGIIEFSHQFQQTNPYEQLVSCYVDVALLHEESRKYDRQFILKKTIDFMNTSDNYYNVQRSYKLDEYKKKLKKPRQQLLDKIRQQQIRVQKQKKNLEDLKRIKQEQEREAEEQKKKSFIEKRVRISEIISAKQDRVVKIGSRRIQNLTDDQIHSISKQTFEELLAEVIARVADNKNNRNKKKFLKIDYNERERRIIFKQKMEGFYPEQSKQKQAFEKMKQFAKADHEEKQKLKIEIEKVAPEVKVKIDEHYNENRDKFQKNMLKFKENLTEQFKKKILNRARELLKQSQQKKKQFQQNRRKQQLQQSNSSDQWIRTNVNKPAADDGGEWRRKQKVPTTQQDTTFKKEIKNDFFIKKGPVTGATSGNKFADLKIDDDQKNTKKEQSKWGRKPVNKVQQTSAQQPQPVEEKKQQIQPTKFVPPPIESSGQSEQKGLWAKGKVGENKPNPKREEPELVFKNKKEQKKEEKKDDNKKPKGRGW